MKKKIIKKEAGHKKTVESVMREFKEGKLKSSDGKIVTDRNQALAIALNEAGLSNKSLEKAEILLKLKTVRKTLETKIFKEIKDQEGIRSEVVKFFKKNPNPDDSKMHGLAVQLQMSPHDLEEVVYSILSDIITVGAAKCEEKPVVQKEKLA